MLVAERPDRSNLRAASHRSIRRRWVKNSRTKSNFDPAITGVRPQGLTPYTKEAGMPIATTVEPTLTVEEQSTFEEMIDASVIARYDSELERHDACDRKGAPTGGHYYTPSDTDRIHELLTKLWGDLLTAEAIDDAFTRLTEDGAGEWPHG